MRVTLWNEHRRAIGKAGYEINWMSPQIVVTEDVYVALAEDNGRRRIAAVKIIDTEDEWIKVKQK